ncbi:MAG: dihydropteroate synthase, partial [Pseudomonadota bacterium]|nr:dihydropteroate synthase [Pseudomonadota bacterium]
MARRVYLRPTAFVDAPFGLDGKVERLAGGLAWFSAVEVVAMDGAVRVSAELVPVESIGDALNSLPDEARRTWINLTAPRAPLSLGERVVRLDQPQVVGIVNVTPDSFSDGGRFADAGEAAEAAHAMA